MKLCIKTLRPNVVHPCRKGQFKESASVLYNNGINIYWYTFVHLGIVKFPLVKPANVHFAQNARYTRLYARLSARSLIVPGIKYSLIWYVAVIGRNYHKYSV